MNVCAKKVIRIPDTTNSVGTYGQTAWSLSRQHTGRTEIPLAEQGEQDAREKLVEEPAHLVEGRLELNVPLGAFTSSECFPRLAPRPSSVIAGIISTSTGLPKHDQITAPKYAPRNKVPEKVETDVRQAEAGLWRESKFANQMEF